MISVHIGKRVKGRMKKNKISIFMWCWFAIDAVKFHLLQTLISFSREFIHAFRDRVVSLFLRSEFPLSRVPLPTLFLVPPPPISIPIPTYFLSANCLLIFTFHSSHPLIPVTHLPRCPITFFWDHWFFSLAIYLPIYFYILVFFFFSPINIYPASTFKSPWQLAK